MTWWASLRYLWLLNSQRRYLTILLLILAIAGVVSEFVQVGSSESWLVGILLLQLFAVSVGFRGPASRGYLDPVLTSGNSRARTAIVHFVAAFAPGLLAWLVTGTAAALRAGTINVIAFRLAGLTALLMASAVSWAVTLPFPPLTGGTVWLLASLGILISGKFSWLAEARAEADWFSRHPFQSVLFGVSFPLFVPTIRFTGVTLAILMLATAAAFSLGILFIIRSEFALVEEG